MSSASQTSSDLDTLETAALPVGHLPLVAAAIRECGISEVFNSILPKHPLSEVSDAECLSVMILNILSGRTALWRMDQWLSGLDTELLLGARAEARFFHDTRLGLFLDHICEQGTDNLMSQIVTRVLRGRLTEPHSIHLDTTSISVEGAYSDAPEPTPTFGHSKDLRPDLKQLIFGLSIRGDIGIPMTMSVASGNTAEQISNRDHISKLSQLLPDPDKVTLVADCKLMDAETIGDVLSAGLHFVTLLPRTFSARAELIDQALRSQPDTQGWPELSRQPGEKKADPPQVYRGISLESSFSVSLPAAPDAPASPDQPPKRRKAQRTFRCLVVHSDQLQKKFDAALDDKIANQSEKLMKKLAILARRGFACEEDARSDADRLVKEYPWLKTAITIESRSTPVKRERRGRPRLDEPREETISWHPAVDISRNDDAIAEDRRHDSCFVLVTDWSADDWTDQRVLQEYRHQSVVEGSTGFRWLKGPTVASPIFLHSTSRIQALGLVMIIALMVRNYLQYRLRAAAERKNEPPMHPFRRKPDPKLTIEMAFAWLEMHCSSRIRLGPDQPWIRPRPAIKPEALHVIGLLGFSADIFRVVPARFSTA